MTKKIIEEYLANATEKISVDIDEDIYNYYVSLAVKVGVPTEDYISAVVIKYLRAIN
jgi:hypothetical protein